MVYAQDWGIELYVDKKIPQRLSYRGVKAHDFVPVSMDDGEQKNVVPVLPSGVIEAPFEQTLLFKNQSNPKQNIWMKQEKGCRSIPEKVQVDAKKILLLEE